jgi:hypothetical protein
LKPTYDPTLPFSQHEFKIALGHKMGSLQPILGSFIGGHAFEATGTYALRMLILTGIASHQHLGFLVIIFYASPHDRVEIRLLELI